MKSESKNSVADSLETGEKLVPYMPYLLQDMWALGSSVDQIIQVLSALTFPQKTTNILDLACGKGAVSVNLAAKFGYQATGIDLMPEFITDAKKYAEKYQVENLCQFKVDDILDYVKNTRDFDAVILASLGGIFGSIKQTIITLRDQVVKGGYIIIDDGYLKNKSHSSRKGYENYKNYNDTKRELTSFGDKIINEVSTTETSKEINDEYLKKITIRCEELIKLHPEIKNDLLGYIKLQKKECEYLEKEIEGVIWVMQKNRESI